MVRRRASCEIWLRKKVWSLTRSAPWYSLTARKQKILKNSRYFLKRWRKRRRDDMTAYIAQRLTISDLKTISEEKLCCRFVCLLENLLVFLRCPRVVAGRHGISTCIVHRIAFSSLHINITIKDSDTKYAKCTASPKTLTVY